MFNLAAPKASVDQGGIERSGKKMLTLMPKSRSAATSGSGNLSALSDAMSLRLRLLRQSRFLGRGSDEALFSEEKGLFSEKGGGIH